MTIVKGAGGRNVLVTRCCQLNNIEFQLPTSLLPFFLIRFLNHYSDALIYNENHVNVRYQPFKVIRPTQIEVIIELMSP